MIAFCSTMNSDEAAHKSDATQSFAGRIYQLPAFCQGAFSGSQEGNRGTAKKAQGKSAALATPLTFPLIHFRFACQFLPSESPTRNRRAYRDEAVGVRDLAIVIAKGLLVKVTKQME